MDKLVGFKPSHQRGIVRFVLFMQYFKVTPIVLYKEQKSSDSNEIVFFQNKRYKPLEVIGTGKSAVQAILSCILWGKAAHGI